MSHNLKGLAMDSKIQRLFRIRPGKAPVALLPEDAEGRPRVVDGASICTIEQAETLTGFNQQYLADLWDGTWGEFVASESGQTSPAAPAPEPTADAAPGAASATDGAVPPAIPVVATRALSLRERIARTMQSSLRKMYYPHVSDDLWPSFMEQCALRGVHPFCGQCFAIVCFDKRLDQLVVKLGLGIEGMRLIAQRTGRRAGRDATVYTENSDGTIETASTTVYALDDAGVRHPYTVLIYMHEYLPSSPEQDPEGLWQRMPRACISRCSEAASLRAAHPQELGGVWTPEELMQIRDAKQFHPKDNGSQFLPGERASDVDAALATPAAGMSWHQFESAIKDRGIADKQTAIVRHYRTAFPAMAESMPRLFYQRVINEIDKDPAKWGVAAAGAVA